MSCRSVCPLFGCALLFLFALLSTSRAAEAPPVVVVSQPVERETADYDFKGRLDPAESVEVRALVSGVLDKVHVQSGAEVKQGDLLFETDARLYANDLKKAIIEVECLESCVQELNEALKEPGNKTREELAVLEAQRDVAVATLRIAKANVERLKQDLEHTKVTASISGRIDKLLVKAGQRVDAGPRSATLLCTIVRTDPVRASFDVNERTLLDVRQLIREGKIKAKKPSEIEVFLGVADEKGFPYRGTIEFIDNRVEPKTGRVRCHAVFPNTDGKLTAACLAPESKKPVARIRVSLGEPRRVLLVAAQAVGSDLKGQKHVLVVNDKDVVEAREVKLGALLDGLQTIEEGLKLTDWVIVGTERMKRDPTDKTLSPEDFAENLKFLGVRPGKIVKPQRSK